MKAIVVLFLASCGVLANASSAIPTNMEFLCVKDCKYGVPARAANGSWSVVPTDVKTFSYHIVTDVSSSEIMFYGNVVPTAPVTVSYVRGAILDGNTLRSTFFHDSSGTFTAIGLINSDGEFELERPEGACSMKLRPDLGSRQYEINCNNSKSGEFELSGILALTQKELPRLH